ncbi:AIPR family protein [Klebsiella quasipneumoniae subsp. similipneumoniae]|uniref:AIPR family protein n=2 Tax=Klebsiella quasipneumoniae TaxID=1463165 RepID=UPI0007CD1A05|nr:AIPR family protein [Klebsiella quasipneumoniae]MCB3003279.1 AIPR family protein [Klebsiella quasipneumoniae]SBI06230.1 AIPR protein [Klebsiella quasipneumoniae]HCI6804971.1 AIPR family protein [Klebsiella quasipneumoniae subsp. similipneumoniae]HDH1513854.1 AIPR family protein [Klebsiella quasipneumoniae subsp. similipneumoniae]
MKYEMLVNILDKIRMEAPANLEKTYKPDPNEMEKVNAARARAFIHLFLKVNFGLMEFKEREKNITDSSYDGGIDGYYIDKEDRLVYLIQSKFRTTKTNFESKDISYDEILCMDVERILKGESHDEAGNEYNGKIKQLQRELSETDNITKFNYKIIILANLKDIQPARLRKLTDGYNADVFDYTRTYNELVFPVISGTLFTAHDICIPIDLSAKNAGSKISYTVKTKASTCEITVLFVPVLEIAKIMSKYKNSILKYNPRSYLEFQGQAVNASIRKTVIDNNTNEFALYNNGITMISDDTSINERIGQKNKAQLSIKNPQIINGGQTSYILSRIYEETPVEKLEDTFNEKEVLLKIITLIDNDNDKNKLELIEAVSEATNKQTPVINADKFANEPIHQQIQRSLFDHFGMLYERKRGEFADGLNFGYITSNQVIERNFFLRIYFAANGDINLGSQKKLFQKNPERKLKIDDEKIRKFYIGHYLFDELTKKLRTRKQHLNIKRIDKSYYGKIHLYNVLFPESTIHDIKNNINILENAWVDFMRFALKENEGIKKLWIGSQNFNEDKYYNSERLEKDLHFYIKNVL